MAGLGKDSYDAVVVGSGFGGAVAACRLAQAGVDVAVIERGARYSLGSFPRIGGRIDRMSWHHGGPYDVRALNDVLVVQGAGYGGGSLIYANVQMRPRRDVFDEGWPDGYSRAALDPYYDLVAYMLDIEPVAVDPATGELPRKTQLMEDAMLRPRSWVGSPASPKMLHATCWCGHPFDARFGSARPLGLHRPPCTDQDFHGRDDDAEAQTW